VGGGGRLQRERRQQREAEHDTGGDHGEPRPVPPGRYGHAQRRQTAARDDGGEGAAHGHERPGAEALQAPDGGGEGEGERGDAEGGLERAGTITAAEVLVTAGGQSALTTALRALAPPGTPVLVESPTYPGMLAIARAAGLRPVPVPVDAGTSG
jgi:DNA-binding transcriptional MocR family regulator